MGTGLDRLRRRCFGAAGLALALLAGWAGLGAGCSTAASSPPAGTAREITLLAINDFHGQLQAADPVPAWVRQPPGADGQPAAPQPAGGIAHLATALRELRAAHPKSLLVGAGDLIGASALPSALLKDEPTLQALSELGLSVTALGNHEFDAGIDELRRRVDGRCPAGGCAWSAFRKPTFEYIAANVVDAQSGQPVFTPWVMREIDGVRVAFVGAVTRSTAYIVKAAGIAGLRFTDEAEAINGVLPAVRRAGADAVVVLIHEGGEFRGPANDPSYRCGGLGGRITEIVPRLDADVSVVISGHTHQAYTCRVAGKLVTQAGNYGGYVTELTLKVDTARRTVLDSRAQNHPVLQSRYAADPAVDRRWQQVDALTRDVRMRPVGPLPGPFARSVAPPRADWPLGNLVTDAQLAAGRKAGPTDVAITNAGGLRADLAPGSGGPTTANLGQLFASQPFGNVLVRMKLKGRDLAEALQRQAIDGPGAPRLLQISGGSRYRLERQAGITRLAEAVINGRPLQPEQEYWVVINDFLAGGGDGFGPFARGREQQAVGGDLDALVDYVAAGQAISPRAGEPRIVVDRP